MSHKMNNKIPYSVVEEISRAICDEVRTDMYVRRAIEALDIVFLPRGAVPEVGDLVRYISAQGHGKSIETMYSVYDGIPMQMWKCDEIIQRNGKTVVYYDE